MVYIIADACVNFRSMQEADLLIKEVVATGCDCIKFQMWKGEHIKGHSRFEELKNIGLEMGFKHIESGPLVRSSYHAEKSMCL